jgi:hypothetical protein
MYYVRILYHFRNAVRRKHLDKWAQNSWFLVHNNAPARRLLVVKKCLAKYSVTALEHASHFLDLSLPDFSLFLRLQCLLKGQQFASANEATAKAMTALT